MIMTNFSDRSKKKSPIISKTTANQAVDQTFHDLRRAFSKREIDQLAWDSGLNKRSSAKVRGFDFLLSLLVASLDPAHASLERISDIFTRVNGSMKVSPQALMKKINSEASVQFLKSIFSHLFKKRLVHISEKSISALDRFTKVWIQDSSVIQLNKKLHPYFKGSGGRASSSFAKLDAIYEYKAKDVTRIKLTDQGEADQRLSLDIEEFLVEDGLVLRDLGYLRVDALERIMAKKAFFLSRLKLDFKVYLSKEDGQEVDLVKHLEEHYSGCAVMDLQVFITKKKVPVRLIVSKAPEEVANKRRREARQTAKKQGRMLKDKTLRLMSLTIFITNVPLEVWKPEDVFTVYGLRWQIELIFKCWKSKLQISYLKGIKAERIISLIYARLALILLVNEIYKLTEFIGSNLLMKEVSMIKVYEWIRDAERLIDIIKGPMSSCERRFFIQTVSKSMCMQTRNRKTTLKRICEIETMVEKVN